MLKTKIFRIIAFMGMFMTLLGLLNIYTQMFFGCYINNFGLNTMKVGICLVFFVCLCGFKADKLFVKSLKILILIAVVLMLILFVISRIARCI